MKFYLSGSWNRRAELQEYAAELESKGHENASSWLLPNEFEERDHELTFEDMQTIARTDIEDVLDAGILIAFTEPPGSPNTRGGRHVEFGLALGLAKIFGITVVVIGPIENVFYAVDDNYRFPDFKTFMESAT